MTVLAGLDNVQQATDDSFVQQHQQTQVHTVVLNVTTNGTVLFLNLTNDGGTMLHVSAVRVLLNGTLLPPAALLSSTVDGLAGTDLWGPQQVLSLQLSASASSGQRVAIVSGGWTAFGVI